MIALYLQAAAVVIVLAALLVLLAAVTAIIDHGINKRAMRLRHERYKRARGPR